MSLATPVPLVIACGAYDEMQALADGTVGVENCTTSFVTLAPGEMFTRAFEDPQFNVAELSLANYLTRRIHGKCEYVAIPVYPARSFRHGTVYVRADGGISAPQDLRGRRIGVGGYAHTAFVWARGILQHEYGLHPSDVKWISVSHNARGHADNQSFQAPAGVSIERIQSSKNVAEMLASARSMRYAQRTPLPLPVSYSLLSDYESVEDDYFRRTQIFPILHIMGVRTELVQRYPGLAQKLFRAFLASKDIALEARSKAAALPSASPELAHHVQRMTALMGKDYHSYGVNERDSKTLAAFLDYHYEQGLSDRRYSIADLFDPVPVSDYAV